MNKKRIVALFVTVMLVLSTVVTVSAAIFPDFESRHSWAEEAVSSMVSRGILKGYTDGTFKPDRAVSHLETLIIASRIMGVDAEENAEYREAAVKAYENALSSYDIDYKDEVAYLLYWNVITTDELSTYISDSAKNSPLKRYEAAVLLTKLIGAENEALTSGAIILDFADADNIPSSAKPYVKFIFDIGLMNGVGENKFDPNAELTRAMISAIMYRAENHMDADVVTGTVDSVKGSTLTIISNGDEEEIEVSDDVVIKVDAKSVELDELSENLLVRVHYHNGLVRMIDGVSKNLYLTVSGTISAISESAGTKKISIKNASGVQTFPINKTSCEYFVDNKISTLSDIARDQFATLTVREGYITSIKVEGGAKTVTGTITDITINEEVCAITVETASGTEVDFVFNDDCKITRNNSNITASSLAIGDKVTLTIAKGGIEKCVATSASKTVKGTITKLVISTTGTTITLKTSTEEVEYGVTSNTTFTVDGKTDCTVYDLRVGASAQARLDSTNISSIQTETAIVSPTLTGTITYVHPTSYVMGLQVTDANGNVETIQTVVKSSVKVTDTTSSNISTFRALTPGMTVVAVGTSNYGVYEVSQIIVTAK